MRIIILLLLSVHSLFSEKYELSILAIFKNEAPYLKEWIEFHKIQGVEHFYLYNNNSTDEYLEVLEPYILDAEVTLVDWDVNYQPATKFTEKVEWELVQRNAYQNGLDLYGEETKWMAVIDIDEFLFCPKGIKLCDFLNNYESYASVAVSQLCFGTSHIKKLAKESLTIENFILCSNLSHERDFYYKSIIQPAKIEFAKTAHYFFPKSGYISVDSRHRQVNHDYLYREGKIDQIRVNHYWTRDETYLNEKKIKSRNQRRSYQTARSFESFILTLNSKKDFAIQQFVPILKQKMNEKAHK